MAAVRVPVQIAGDGEQVAFHGWLTDSFARQPRGHKGIRSDFIGNHGITGQKQCKSANVGRIPLIKALDVRHFSLSPFRLRANSRKVTADSRHDSHTPTR
jgi:hypothetical protein